ncbi:hypothetical protein [Burkholderia gladioli]|uniref:hypothetical protein n=1 Tax=Burkholderia gladioli TaxID=28095 RepID=UPI00163EA838|nr:hypothetical protein [Burkholderia gladioli]MBJ9677912.1 hypothetical protein [Burkholderia gladioli]
MNFWQTALLAVGGNAALLAVLGWLAKSLLEKLLTKDVERFKASLASEAQSAIERLKHDLQLTAVEHQVRFANLHERRAQVVADLYGLLVEAYWATSGFVSPAEWAGEPNKRQKYVVAMNSIADFFRFFEKSKIYLPKTVCDQLEEFVNGMRKKVVGFGIYVRTEDPNLPLHALEQKHKVWQESWEFFENQVPPARNALEDELRGILGAK